VISTSTRNFPNRLGKGADVFLGSAELAAVAGILGKLPTREEYLKATAGLNPLSKDIYRYLNFNELSAYTEKAAKGRSLPLVG
jgi:aconitate hydratase 2 / 2-methylisocitrate dehydratase